MKNKVKYWAPVVVWCGLIFTLSSIPHLSTGWGVWDVILRKCAHVVEYTVLFLLTNRALAATTAWPSKTCLISAFIFAVLYACSDEFHQSFVPGRVASVIDVGIDSLGAVVGLIIKKR
ncbi:MAG: VanZ family protein [Endomicrobiales bacterium]|jgi:VanZ family protein